MAVVDHLHGGIPAGYAARFIERSAIAACKCPGRRRLFTSDSTAYANTTATALTGDLRDAFIDNVPFGDNAAQERRRCSGAWTAPARAARPWRYRRWCGACARSLRAKVAVCTDHWTHAFVLRATQRGQERQGLGGCKGTIGRLHRLAALGRRCRPALGRACIRAPAAGKRDQGGQQRRWLEKDRCKEDRSKEERNQAGHGKKTATKKSAKKTAAKKTAPNKRATKKTAAASASARKTAPSKVARKASKKAAAKSRTAEKNGATKKAPSRRTAAKKGTSTAAKKRATKTSAPWNTSSPKGASHSKPLSPSQKAQARKRAKAAGRPYPNLVDNMAVASKRSTSKRAAKSSGVKKRAGTK
ncbi:putative DNA-binding protein [Xanthomonas citri pv. punicae str. LMG 859]|nr:putative DNA-binding protein [Xanthomonas citri pv. punicae str. LMG 859]